MYGTSQKVGLCRFLSGTCRSQSIRVETSVAEHPSAPEELRARRRDEGEDAAEGGQSQEVVDPGAFRAQRPPRGQFIQEGRELHVKQQKCGESVFEVQTACEDGCG